MFLTIESFFWQNCVLISHLLSFSVIISLKEPPILNSKNFNKCIYKSLQLIYCLEVTWTSTVLNITLHHNICITVDLQSSSGELPEKSRYEILSYSIGWYDWVVTYAVTYNAIWDSLWVRIFHAFQICTLNFANDVIRCLYAASLNFFTHVLAF